MSETTAFEDLNLLDTNDLRAVIAQLPSDQVVAALWGAHAGLRTQLLSRLPKRQAEPIERAIAATEHISFARVCQAQQQLVATMYRLSRAGIIAFDIPEDMIA